MTATFPKHNVAESDPVAGAALSEHLLDPAPHGIPVAELVTTGTIEGLVAQYAPDPDLSGYATTVQLTTLGDDVAGHGARLDDVEASMANLVMTTDPRLADARDPLPHGHVLADVAGLQGALDAKQPVGSYATLDGLGRVPNAQLPPLAITDTYTAASEAAMLALSLQRGDVVIRTDISRTYVARVDAPAAVADFSELLSPVAPVQSVNGQIGVVNVTLDSLGYVAPDPPDLSAYARSGVVNGLSADVLLTPTAGTQDSGVIVKSPDADWGNDAQVLDVYGGAQAFVVLKEGNVGDPGIATSDDLVLFRVNGRGAMGLAGGMHVATGLRARPGDTFNYSIHVNPSVDTTGLIVDAANDAPAQPWQQWRLHNGTVVAELAADQWMKTNRGLLAQAAGLGSPAALFRIAPGGTPSRNVVEFQDSVGVLGGAIGPTANTALFPFFSNPTAPDTAPVLSITSTSILNVARGATQLPLVSRGAVSATGDLFQAQNSAGTVLASVSATGAVIGRAVAGQAPAANWTPLSSQGFAGQTADLIVARTSTGTTVLGVDPNGRVHFGAGASDAYIDATSQFVVRAARAFAVGHNAGRLGTANLSVTVGAASDVGVATRGAVSQTGDLEQWQSSAGSVLAKVDALGVATAAGFASTFFVDTAQTGPYLSITSATAQFVNRNTVGNVPLGTKGMAGQTGDLFQAQNSTSTVLLAIESDGDIRFGVNGGGIVLRSASGTVRKVTLNDAGNGLIFT